MNVPTIDLDGRDVEFVVQIDGKKRGVLRLSQGSVDWKPSRQRTTVRTASWSALVDWLES